MEKRQVRQAASAVTDTQVTLSASPEREEGARHPGVAAMEPTGTTNRFPDQEGLIR